jgi:hypothetical protein
VEGDGLGLDLALLHVDLVTAENDRDVLADTDEVTCSDVSFVFARFVRGYDVRCQLGTFL